MTAAALRKSGPAMSFPATRRPAEAGDARDGENGSCPFAESAENHDPQLEISAVRQKGWTE